MHGIYALIPARSGSKGVPDKNIRNLAGHSLLAWSISVCLKSNLIDRVIVSTDSEAYANLALSLGAEVPFLRPAHISHDTSSDLDFIMHALEWFHSVNSVPKYIAHMRPTTPLRLPQIIDDAIREFVGSQDATSLRSVHKMSESAYKTFELNEKGYLRMLGASNSFLDLANSARQLYPQTYFANGYVDVLSVEYILGSGFLHGDKVIPFITPFSVEVDTEEDFDHLIHKVSSSPDYLRALF